MSVVFSHELAWYLAEGWTIVSTAAYGVMTPKEDSDADRIFLVTVQKGVEVRVLGYENFLDVDADDIDPSPYRASFVKNLAGNY